MEKTSEKQNEKRLLKALGVFASCALLSYLGWRLLGLIPITINGLIEPGNCAELEVGSMEMFLCSAKVGLLSIAGSVILIVFLFIFRKSISAFVKKYTPRIPADYRFLIAPLVATLFFVITWAGMHYTTGSNRGLLPQKAFPALIGLFIYLTTSYQGWIKEKLVGFLDFRDKIPKWARIGIMMVFPFLFSLLLNQGDISNYEAARNEQLTVLATLIIGYLAVMPREGSIQSQLKNILIRK